MENKKYENRAAYAALILVLTVLAALVVVLGVASRRARPAPDAGSTEQVTHAMAPRDTAEHDPNGRTTDAPVVKPDTDTREPAETKPADTQPEESDGVDDVDAPSELPEFTSPVDGVVSKAHSGSVLVYSLTMDDYRTHTGVDVATSAGADVRAAAAGVVSEVWDDPFWGVCITVSHEGDAVTVYRNLSPESNDASLVGRQLAAGDVIGTVGESALYEIADEPHLHFELKIAGENVDPCDYVTFNASDNVHD